MDPRKAGLLAQVDREWAEALFRAQPLSGSSPSGKLLGSR